MTNFLNRENGWIYIGELSFERRILIEFAPSCVVVLEQKQLKAIWLQPRLISNRMRNLGALNSRRSLLIGNYGLAKEKIELWF
jgi:hypothetical protein